MTVWRDQTLCWWEAPLNPALTYKIEVLPNRLYRFRGLLYFFCWLPQISSSQFMKCEWEKTHILYTQWSFRAWPNTALPTAGLWPPDSRPISAQTQCNISLCRIAGFTPGQWRRERRGAWRQGGIWRNYELWPLLRVVLAFALQSGFGGNWHCVTTQYNIRLLEAVRTQRRIMIEREKYVENENVKMVHNE